MANISGVGLKWDQDTERTYYTGVDGVVLFVADANGNFKPVTDGTAKGVNGVAWSGVTAINESPSGAESNKYYADNIEYLNIISKEEFGFTIEAYQCPEAFDACDGIGVYADNDTTGDIKFSAQPRRKFALVYRVQKGTDSVAAGATDADYIYHIVYNCTASPSSQDHSTVNDSVEPATFSWEVTTTGLTDHLPSGIKSTSHIMIDGSKLNTAKLNKLKAALYGTVGENGTLIPPEFCYPDDLQTKLNTQ